MNIIRCTYPNTEVFKTTYILSFLRLAGIFVAERFWESEKIQKNLNFEPDSDMQLNKFTNYDVDLFIISNEEEEIIASYYKEKSKNPKIVIRINEDDTGYQLVEKILVELQKNFVINSGESKALHALLEIYDSEKACQLIYKTMYFDFNEDNAKLILEDYDKIFSKILKVLQENNVKDWGSADFMHSQFAYINTAYEIDCFCRRNKIPAKFIPDSLLPVCEKTKEVNLEFRESILMLEGKIVEDLLHNSNRAYEFYVNCQKKSGKYYNLESFQRRAHYHQKYNIYDKAAKLYNECINLFPEDYYNWFKIGFCCSKDERWKEAILAYENVGKILRDRLFKNIISPLEIETLFKSQHYALRAFIELKTVNWEKIKEFFDIADKAIEAVETSLFFKYICKDDIEEEKLREYTKERMKLYDFYDCTAESLCSCFGEEKRREKYANAKEQLTLQKKYKIL